MAEARACPVCGSTRIKVHSSDNKLLVGPAPVVCYRCEDGHVFYVHAEGNAASTVAGE